MMAFRLTGLVTLGILATYVWTALLVGKARATHGIKPPTTTGPEAFERIYRVHVNTLEQMAIMLPALWLSAGFVGDWFAAASGVVWIAGRVWFAQGYAQAAERRGGGFALTMTGFGLAFVGAVVGIALTFVR